MRTFADAGRVRIGDTTADFQPDTQPVPHVRAGSWVFEHGEWVLRRDDAATLDGVKVRLGGTVEDFRTFCLSRVLPL